MKFTTQNDLCKHYELNRVVLFVVFQCFNLNQNPHKIRAQFRMDKQYEGTLPTPEWSLNLHAAVERTRHILRQSRSDSGLGFQVKAIQTFQVLPFSLGSRVNGFYNTPLSSLEWKAGECEVADAKAHIYFQLALITENKFVPAGCTSPTAEQSYPHQGGCG